MTTLAGAHAIVTGGSEGIGRALATHFVDRGARVSIVSRSVEKLAAARSRLDDRVETAAADVTDPAALSAAIAGLVAAQGPCDVLVPCAGAAEPGYFEQLDPGAFRRQMDLNYFGTLHAIRAVVPQMIERGRGHLVIISSTVGFLGVFGYAAYAPTKFAVRGLGETLHGELAPHGIRVSIAYPPDTDTPGLARENHTKPAETAAISAAIAPKPAAEVAAAIVRGIERDKLTITADRQTALLARAGGMLGPVVRASMARTVRRVRTRSGA